MGNTPPITESQVVFQPGDATLLKDKAAPPPMYRVIVLNDDFTPMDFVVEILVRFFRMTVAKATETMLKIHQSGYAVCGVYTLEIAETKAQQVNEAARRNQHPLRCEIEQAEHISPVSS